MFAVLYANFIVYDQNKTDNTCSYQKLFDLFQETFAAMIEDSGFSNVTFENLSFGVVAIHSGFKI